MQCPHCGLAVTAANPELAPRYCPRCIGRRGAAVQLAQRDVPPKRTCRLLLYAPNRSDQELEALERIDAELEDGSVQPPDGGGFATVEVAAAGEDVAAELVRAAIARAHAVGLIELA